jgi:hypothetical protein
MKRQLINRTLILLGFQAIFSFQLIAQSKSELVSFSIPKTLFFTDEKIWINGEAQMDGRPSISQVFYAELIDRENRSWVISKFPLKEGKVFNYMALPNTIPSGNYLLRVFTRTSPYQSIKSGIAQQLVTILNPTIPPTLGTSNKKSPILEAGVTPVSISKEIIEKSGAFSIKLNLPEEQIVSIKLSSENPYLSTSGLIDSDLVYESIEKSVFLPELFGHIVHGKLIGSQADTTKTYFLSAHGKKSALYTDRPDKEGNLFFDLGGFKHWDHLLIQVEDGSNLNAFEVQLPSPKTKFNAAFKVPELTISREDEEFLRKMKLASAIEPYYAQVYQNDSMSVVTGFVADQTYLLDDYTRFDNLETVIKEYVPNVSVRKKDKLKEFRIINIEAGYLFEGNPLMMIDALPIFNSDMLASFNPKFFYKLDVLNREFYLNDRKYDGVMNFSSYENNFGLFPIPNEVLYLDYAGYNPYIVLDRPIYASVPDKERMPDFRSNLFWYQKGVDKISSEFQLSASELTGNYVLEVEFLDESGRSNFWKKGVQVK